MHRPASRRPRGRRRRLPGRSDDLLLRRMRRRRMEDHRRRLDLAVRDRRLSHHGGRRRARGGAVRPQRHLRRHRRSLHPQRRVARRRRLPIRATAARRGRTSDWRDTRHIGRIVVHPRDPDLVYVAALGHAWGTNKQRGIFRSQRRRRAIGSTSCSRASAPARTTSRSTRSIPTSSTRRSGRRSAIRTR